MYTIAFDNKDIVIRSDEQSVDKKVLTNFLGLIELEQIRKRSKLTDEQIEVLSKEINQRAWDKMKNNALMTI
ncbi:hypothetical protein JW960_20685 [candidate division KSB1 bacterium]|nr:hypothetical protein [candidate division KSB1 bacterium]